MNKTKSFLNYTLILLVLPLLIACTAKTTPTPAMEEPQAPAPLVSSIANTGDGGLLSEPSCKPPCFWGITPGLTLEAQAWEVIESKGLTNVCRAWDSTTTGSPRGIVCTWDNQSVGIGLESQTDGIQHIAFPPSETILLSDIITAYGTPSGLVVWEGNQAVELAVFYDEITTQLDFLRQNETVYNLQPKAEIVRVTYMSKQQYEVFIQSIENERLFWHGYGEYER